MNLGFVFPGQGSQHVGMASELAACEPVAAATLDAANDALGFDLRRLMFEGPAEELDRTEHTQPALVTAAVAAWRVWQARGGRSPTVVAGHSLGEYAALVAAGALEFADAVRLTAERGRLMQGAAPPGAGAMAAIIGLDAADVERLCFAESKSDDHRVQPANLNAPGQVVIAGHRAAVEAAMAAAKDAGAKRALPLKVSVAAHSALMAPAVEAFRNRLDEVEFSRPEIPVIHNATLDSAADPAAIRAALAAQLTAPVRWVETVEKLVAGHGVEAMVECGPGTVLAGLNRRINRNVPTHAVMTPEQLSETLGGLT